jgi:hypothetical protein
MLKVKTTVMVEVVVVMAQCVVAMNVSKAPHVVHIMEIRYVVIQMGHVRKRETNVEQYIVI